MPIPKIESFSDHKDVYVSINGLTHIHFLREKYIAMQTWYQGSGLKRIYSIEILLEGATLLTEYDDYLIWSEVIGHIKNNI